MDIDDKELFSSAMTDEPIPEVIEQPVTEATPQQEGQQRDEHGRFARAEQPQSEPQQPQAADQAKDEANVPSWRLREVREEAERRVAETEARWQRQFAEMQRQAQPKPEPLPKPDWYENPDGAVKHGVQEYVDPQIQQLRDEITQLKNSNVSEREQVSREQAIEKYGEQAVRSAYVWVAEGIQKGDPNVAHAYNQVMQSRRPFDSLVQIHQEISLMQQIKAAGGVDGWREQQLNGGQQQQQGRQQSSQPQGSITKLPPSLRNTPSSRSGNDDDNSDVSDAALFRHAMR